MSATTAPTKYERLYRTLKRELLTGDLSYERPLATEHALAEKYGVSRVTVRRALKLLEADGLIVRKRRLGTFPARRLVPFQTIESLSQLTEETRWLAANTYVNVLRFYRRSAPQSAREALRLPTRSRITQFDRIRMDGEEPIAHLSTVLPIKYGEQLSRDELRNAPPLVLLKQKGVKLKSTQQSVSARNASPELAGHLDILPQAPLLRTTLLVLGKEREPISYTVAHLRADRFELRYGLTETGSQGAPQVWQLKP